MNTSELIGYYLAARRATGTSFKSGQRLLYQFARETGDLPLAGVTPQAVSVFLRGHGQLSAAWKTRYGLLTGLYRFAIARGYVQASPLPAQHPKLPPQITPYVYSRDELQRLLDSTDSLISPWSRAAGTHTQDIAIAAVCHRTSSGRGLAPSVGGPGPSTTDSYRSRDEVLQNEACAGRRCRRPSTVPVRGPPLPGAADAAGNVLGTVCIAFRASAELPAGGYAVPEGPRASWDRLPAW